MLQLPVFLEPRKKRRQGGALQTELIVDAPTAVVVGREQVETGGPQEGFPEGHAHLLEDGGVPKGKGSCKLHRTVVLALICSLLKRNWAHSIVAVNAIGIRGNVMCMFK